MLRNKIGTISVETASLYIGDPGLIQQYWKKDGEVIGVLFLGMDAKELVDVIPGQMVGSHFVVDLNEMELDDLELQMDLFYEKFEAYRDRMPQIEKRVITNSTYAALYGLNHDTYGSIYRHPFHDNTTDTFPMGALFNLGKDGGVDVYEVLDEKGNLVKVELVASEPIPIRASEEYF